MLEADSPFAKKAVELEYRPYKAGENWRWYWVLHPEDRQRALAHGEADSRAAASTEARLKARQLKAVITKVSTLSSGSMTESLAIFNRLFEQEEEQDAQVPDDYWDYLSCYGEPLKPPPEYSLEQRRPHVVYEHGNYIFLKMPNDPDYLQREGVAMKHCLSWAHKDYCERMIAGEVEIYSMVDTRDNQPKVDIEVALTQASYSNQRLQKPVVSQIRGPRNEVPPKDEFLEPLLAFFTDCGRNWQLSGHGVANFDGRTDGDLFVRRCRQLGLTGD